MIKILADCKEVFNQGYKIVQFVKVGNTCFVLGFNEELATKNLTTPYVTWMTDENLSSFVWGHYFKTEYNAEVDLVQRAASYIPRPQIDYD